MCIIWKYDLLAVIKRLKKKKNKAHAKKWSTEVVTTAATSTRIHTSSLGACVATMSTLKHGNAISMTAKAKGSRKSAWMVIKFPISVWRRYEISQRISNLLVASKAKARMPHRPTCSALCACMRVHICVCVCGLCCIKVNIGYSTWL